MLADRGALLCRGWQLPAAAGEKKAAGAEATNEGGVHSRFPVLDILFGILLILAYAVYVVAVFKGWLGAGVAG